MLPDARAGHLKYFALREFNARGAAIAPRADHLRVRGRGLDELDGLHAAITGCGPQKSRPSPQGRAGNVFVTCDPRRSMSSSVSFPAVVHCLRTLSLVAVDLV